MFHRHSFFQSILPGGCVLVDANPANQIIRDLEAILVDANPVNQIIRDLEEKLGAIDDNVLHALTEIALQSTGISLAVQIGVYAKLADLKTKALGHWKELPEALINAAQRFYKVDLKNVRYADNICVGMGSGVAVTFENEIFFPRAIDPLGSDLHWMLHELTHVEQYHECGGLNNFIRKYASEAIIQAIKNKTFNPHDHMDIEKAANQKADKHHSEIADSLRAGISRYCRN